MTKNQMGLVFGFFLAIMHIVWLLLVALLPIQMQNFGNWMFGLHGMSIAFLVTFTTWTAAITLIALNFVFGYIGGYVFGWLVGKVKK